MLYQRDGEGHDFLLRYRTTPEISTQAYLKPHESNIFEYWKIRDKEQETQVAITW